LIDADVRPDLARIDCPTLILHGDKDASAPLESTGRRFAAGVRAATPKGYAGAPHGLCVNHTDEVHREPEPFLTACAVPAFPPRGEAGSRLALGGGANYPAFMSLRDFAIMMAVCLIWAANNIISKYVVSILDVPPLFYAAARFFLVAVATVPF